MPAEIKAYARPRELFRYRSLGINDPKKFNQELDALVSGYVYCPCYSAMNDPMEGSHRESALLKESKFHERRRQQVETALATFGIASFSETRDHELMWAHYAANYSGICIEYDVRRLLRNLPDDHEMVRMTYNEKAPILYRDKETPENKAKLILSCKSLRWSGEREWRLIRPTIGRADYGEGRAAVAVFLGSRISAEHEDAIHTALEPQKIPVSKMKLDTYNLAFEAPKQLSFRKTAKSKAGK
ncbi:DUF2971 domain-containing protein [Rhizobium sp. P007]|uniref:DUF2971 domain-containing protein n=1 Tax=Rhizobium sp. P007 TaxID=285908 RepID=UPI001156ECE2|nr:DUF2971 domain-containing protein [Rhizobium sp. P007]CAD7058572.1 hypothetical protein RP007_02576 [Rhizobium sp. P007]